eukprot:CAMPEP_0204609322 /NCGR_PEP_ID=MMETSP0661-20131031/60848_1 /ASSEMBLY_ACC=CAM_ASM_000606 /TAXON_ID=109239 /ORGANISM="Alexandrium margalefi, Strain AMGDE01CS-322" /LENGTH=56 /DNA_ID=CAMNT_0051620971 /DNA_START=38 /DNA_END=206 /DNA_ORIENTATION=-
MSPASGPRQTATSLTSQRSRSTSSVAGLKQMDLKFKAADGSGVANFRLEGNFSDSL